MSAADEYGWIHDSLLAQSEFATWQVGPAGVGDEPDGWHDDEPILIDIDDELGPDGWPKAWGPRPGPSD